MGAKKIKKKEFAPEKKWTLYFLSKIFFHELFFF